MAAGVARLRSSVDSARRAELRYISSLRVSAAGLGQGATAVPTYHGAIEEHQLGTNDPDSQLLSLGWSLPAARPPAGAYSLTRRHGSILVTSGHASHDGREYLRGTLGDDVDIEAGRAAVEAALLRALGSVSAELGSLSAVDNVIQLHVMLRTTPEFTDHALVADAGSELLLAVFGERGRHARAAVGMVSLPFGAIVEVELVVSVRPAS